jgi:hypothetical protein
MKFIKKLFQRGKKSFVNKQKTVSNIEPKTQEIPQLNIAAGISKEIIEISVLPIEEILIQNLFYQQTTVTNALNGEIKKQEIRAKLSDGNITTIEAIEKGQVFQCPSCKRWMARGNKKKCKVSGRLLCSECAIQIGDDFYSKKEAWKKRIREFWAAGNEL